ncbi:MAG: DNA mismatch repair protein MutS [Desulfobacterales bacterium]|nr:DNA mismatch repair protein MutS [Desulfobacterales bacterium]
MSSSTATPMIQQYLAIKETYPDVLLFYRMGDFYEMFFEDAQVASKALEITLTSRNKKDKTPIPMCGVPVRAVQGYIARLLEKGHKVAVCEQVEDPTEAKGLVKREVVRVITPGMILENEYLDAASNNYVLALARNRDALGLAYLDLSTGTFRLTESGNSAAVADEALRVGPSEVVLPASAGADEGMKRFVELFRDGSHTYLEDRAFEPDAAYRLLIEQLGTRSLQGFGCEDLKAGVAAAGALLRYVRETQKQKVEHIRAVETYSLDGFLQVDELSCRNLELMTGIQSGGRKGTLIEVLDRTVTAMGARMLRHWIRYPLLEPSRILDRLDAVQEVKEAVSARRQLRETLQSVYDLERLGSKISMGHGNARDLVALKRSIQSLPDVLEGLAGFDSPLFQWGEEPTLLYEAAELIEQAIREDAPPTVNEGGLIRSGFREELDELIGISRDGKGWLASLEARQREATGIGSLKVRYNKVFGYYIEVPKSQGDRVPEDYVRKQTLVNAERYITDELKEFEAKVLGAEERRCTLEYEIFCEIREAVMRRRCAIQSAAEFLGRTDALLNLAEIADQEDFNRPEINEEGVIHIEEGRHPVVEKMLTAERFVPNTLRLDNEENQVLIITGPNMAGKSTVLRQVALLVLMAHMGSFVPASTASICITDRIFTRVGALDNLSQGQSTFMVEMEETANILNNATEKSLVILDEIGRGTSTYDGLSIAWAVAEHLHGLRGKGVKTLFATHYHELTALEERSGRVKNYSIAVKEWSDEIIFLRKLVEGGTNRSYGIQVARLAGVPESVVRRAKQILFRIESGEAPCDGADAPTLAPPPSAEQGPVQLELFGRPQQQVLSRLKKADLSQMTPLQALNWLSELQQLLKA